MFKVLSNKKIAESIYLMEIEAPFVAKRARAGQFLIIRVDEKGERIPLTVADRDDKNISVVYQVAGVTTHRMSEKKEGDFVRDVVGPLGHPTDIKKIGTVCCIGGGVGIAELYPVAKSYKEIGNKVIAVIGARNKDHIIFRDRLKKVSDEFFITTDDGSEGRKGFVSDVLKELIERDAVIDLIYSVGPAIMMKAVSDISKPCGIKTLVSLNTVLVDGTGMCGSCRISVGGETKFACVDGPEFDGHKVDFGELMSRQVLFREQEEHACKIRGIKKTN